MWSDRIRANDAGRGGWGDQWSQGSTHGVRAVQGSQGHPTTRRHTRDLNPRRNPTPCAQCQNRQRSGWRSRENAQGRRARHCLTRRWPWCTRTRTRTPLACLGNKTHATIRNAADHRTCTSTHPGTQHATQQVVSGDVVTLSYEEVGSHAESALPPSQVPRSKAPQRSPRAAVPTHIATASPASDPDPHPDPGPSPSSNPCPSPTSSPSPMPPPEPVSSRSPDPSELEGDADASTRRHPGLPSDLGPEPNPPGDERAARHNDPARAPATPPSRPGPVLTPRIQRRFRLLTRQAPVPGKFSQYGSATPVCIAIPLDARIGEEGWAAAARAEAQGGAPAGQPAPAAPPGEMLCSYLPVRDYGFCVILQGNFELTTARDGILESNEWNRSVPGGVRSEGAQAAAGLCLGSGSAGGSGAVLREWESRRQRSCG